MSDDADQHERLAELDIKDAVSTEGTNWSFVGEPGYPAWKNDSTGHRLLIEPASSSSSMEYRIQLNHESQNSPFWTVTELDFAPEAIPLVEWVLSSPEDDLFNREAVYFIVEPFWDSDDFGDRSETHTN